MFNLEEALLFKHNKGQKKYNPFSFLNDDKDMNEETKEELIDAINYQIYKLIVDTFGVDKVGSWTVDELNETHKGIVTQIAEGKDCTPVINQLRELIKLL